MKYSIILSIILFLFIYSPPIFPVNILHILAFCSYLIIFLKYRKTFSRFILYTPLFLSICGVIASLVLLAIILTMTTKDYLQLYSLIIIILEVIPISLLIAIILKDNNYKINDFFKILLNIAFVQSLFSILMFFNLDFKNYILSNFYQAYLTNDVMMFWSQYRLNGLSQGLMFAMPVVQGFLAVIAFLFYYKRNILYILYIPFLLFSAIINARTGLLVFFVGVLIVLLFNFKWSKLEGYLKVASFIIIFILISIILLISISSHSEYVADWILESLDETFLFIQGENTGYYDAVDSMFFLPETYEFFVGTGRNYFVHKYINSGTDIGYVNDLFLGGIFFVVTFYTSMLLLFMSAGIRGNWVHRSVIFLMIITMFIVNIKGFAFHQNDFVNLFVLISVVLIFYKEPNPISNKSNIS